MRNSRPLRDSLFFAYRDLQRAVRTPTHKLIRYTVGGSRREQLFDLRSDPGELTNLLDAKPEEPVAAQLRQELSRWMLTVSDPLART